VSLPQGCLVRRARPDDWPAVTEVMVDWWGGRDLRALLPSIFFEHFTSTSLIVERRGDLVAFLVGFLCQDHADEAYIHFVGVDPGLRHEGIAHELYRRFYAVARAHDRHVVRAVTSPVNQTSIAYHVHLGFRIVTGDGIVDGVPVTLNEDGPGEHRVHFELHLEAAGGPA
jgi:N-acetylglutamate synthase-like GNAT family acetyltransferase